MASVHLSTPAMAAPQGVSPNFEHPENNNDLARVSFAIMLVVSTLCVLLRVYGRVYLLKRMLVEDVLILCAYGNYWGCTWACYALIQTPGFFVHTWDILLPDVIQAYYYVFVYGVFYSVVLAPLKVAILVDWCRIFVPGTRTFFFWGSVAVIVLQIAFGIAAIFLLNFQCVPREAIWDFTIKARCLPLNALQVTASTVHIVSDVAIFLLPQKIIWSLNMSLRRRWGVAVIFGLGALAVACSIMRLVATIEFGKSEDKMYTIGPVILWATGEMVCGFFVVCVPTLPKVLTESPLAGTIKRIIGLGKSKGTGENSLRPEGSERRLVEGPHKLSRAEVAGAYCQLDEESVSLQNLQSRGAMQSSQI